MELKKEQLSVWLVGASVLVLLVNYKLVSIGGFSLSFGSFDLTDIKFSELFPVLVAVSVTLGLLIYHIINMTQSLSYMYRSGYAESAKFQELVRAKVSAAAGTEKYGSPCGGLQHGLRRCHSFRVFLQWYGPIVLALWALVSVAV